MSYDVTKINSHYSEAIERIINQFRDTTQPVWILADGTWNDSGVWVDGEIWND